MGFPRRLRIALLALIATIPTIAGAADQLAQVFEQAVASLSAGDYAAAEAGFRKVLAAQPNHVGALGNLGVVYSRSSRFDQAIDVYQRALRIAPADRGLLLNLGLAYTRQDAHGEALPIFERLAKAAPGNRQANLLLSTSQLHTGQLSAAVSGLESLRSADAHDAGVLYLLGVGYLKQRQTEKARAAFDAFLAEAPPAKAAFVMCKAHYESERFEEAAELCRKTLELDSSFAGAHRELGKVLVSQRAPEASKELAAAVAQDPADAEAVYFLGAALLQEERTTEAMRYLERARELNPGFWGSYFYLGKARLQAGDTDAAIALLRRAAGLNPGESAVQYQLGRALSAAGKTQEAAAAMQRVREIKAQELERETQALGKR